MPFTLAVKVELTLVKGFVESVVELPALAKNLWHLFILLNLRLLSEEPSRSECKVGPLQGASNRV